MLAILLNFESLQCVKMVYLALHLGFSGSFVSWSLSLIMLPFTELCLQTQAQNSPFLTNDAWFLPFTSGGVIETLVLILHLFPRVLARTSEYSASFVFIILFIKGLYFFSQNFIASRFTHSSLINYFVSRVGNSNQLPFPKPKMHRGFAKPALLFELWSEARESSMCLRF